MFAPLHLDQPLGLGLGAQQSRIPGGCHCHRTLGTPPECPPPALPNGPVRPSVQSSSKIPGQPLQTGDKVPVSEPKVLRYNPFKERAALPQVSENGKRSAPTQHKLCWGDLWEPQSSQKDQKTPSLKEPDYGRLSSFTLLLGRP